MTNYKWLELSKKDRNILVAEKVMGQKYQIDFGIFEEHLWKRDEDGFIDTFGMAYDHHNGPSCDRCGYSYCEHCQDGPDKPCRVKVSNYVGDIHLARTVLNKFKGWQIKLFEDAQIYQVCINGKFGNAITESEAICLAALRAIGINIT